MPFLPVADGVQVELVHLLDGSTCETAPVFLDRTPGGGGDALALGAAVDEWWVTRVLPHLSVSLSYTRYLVRSLASASGPVTRVDKVPPLTGGIGGGPQPANVALRLNYKVDPQLFGFTGCGFVPGVPQAVVAGNTVDLTWRATLLDAYNDLIGLVAALGWQWIVVHKFRRGHLLPAAGRMRIIRVDPSGPWVSQRRSRLHNDPLP